MRFRDRTGQSTAEYAIVLGVVIAALVGMQVYVKRGLNAKLKGVSDHFAAQVGEGGGALAGAQLKQYEPYYTGAGAYESETTRQNVTETMTAGGTIARTGIDEETKRKSTADTVQGTTLATDDFWQ